jgi:hypothetical protein
MRYGAELTEDFKKQSIFKLCINRSNVMLVELLLLDENCDLNSARDDEGNTPLHIAAFHNNRDHCETLIHHGANILAKNNFGQLPGESGSVITTKFANEAIEYLRLCRAQLNDRTQNFKRCHMSTDDD